MNTTIMQQKPMTNSSASQEKTQMSHMFTKFTKKQQYVIDLMIDLHTLNHDDIEGRVSLYLMKKLTEMKVFDYDKADEFWDFSNEFYNRLCTMGVIDRHMGERI